MDPSIGAIKTQGDKGTESTTGGVEKIFQRERKWGAKDW
jgi:hypothetical protein